VGLICLTAAAPPARAASPDVGAQIAAASDELAVARQARLTLARQIDREEDAAAAETLAQARLRLDEATFPLLDPVEEALLGPLVGDYRYLAMFRQWPPARPPSCCRTWGDPLLPTLLRQRRRARATSSARLSVEDNRFVDLLLLSAAGEERGEPGFVPTPLGSDAAEAYLKAYPRTPYAGFLLQTVVVRHGPPTWALVTTLGPTLDQTMGAARDQLGSGVGFGASLELAYRGVALGMLVLIDSDRELREPFVQDGVDWPARQQLQRNMMIFTLGYRATLRRRHRAQAALGLGTQGLRREGDPERGTHQQDTDVFSGAASLEYQLAVGPLATQGQVVGGNWLLTGRLTFVRALRERQALAPTAVLLQLGVGFELYTAPRITTP
jgi:hypothetical protein